MPDREEKPDVAAIRKVLTAVSDGAELDGRGAPGVWGLSQNPVACHAERSEASLFCVVYMTSEILRSLRSLRMTLLGRPSVKRQKKR
jgi:hypothetical protein